MDLLALADFNLVARHGGFGRAARAAERPKATLSRRVAELERSLNLRLFERGGRTLKLTEEGRALFERTAALLTELDETAAAIASGGARPRGKLRISAPLFFAQTAMGKLAAGFALEHPHVRLEVTTEDRSVDMIEEGYDLVIRVNPDVDESLIGRIFMHDRLVVVASPHLDRPAVDVPVAAVTRGPGDRMLVWDIASPTGRTCMTIDPVLSLSTLVMVRDAVLAGVGVGRLPVSLVGQDLRDGTLVHWGDIDAPDVALWALYPSRRLLSARVSAFLDYLRRAFPNGAPEELAAFMAR
ncbi:LysR substrate-binding domain-containing protein [Pseudomonas sp. Ps21-P2]|uniref:LysR family transcriptional regulator n=1 Tax=Pseudomonas sp. Ps21-P2 TaxID=3080331 RepID=UPI00320894A5